MNEDNFSIGAANIMVECNQILREDGTAELAVRLGHLGQLDFRMREV